MNARFQRIILHPNVLHGLFSFSLHFNSLFADSYIYCKALAGSRAKRPWTPNYAALNMRPVDNPTTVLTLNILQIYKSFIFYYAPN